MGIDGTNVRVTSWNGWLLFSLSNQCMSAESQSLGTTTE